MTTREELERRLAERMRDLAWSADRISKAFASAHALHPTDFHALTAVYRADLVGQPLNGRALAGELGLPPGATTYAVDRLVASGHITRDPSPGDRRRMELHFAPHGHEVASAFFGPLGAASRAALDRYSDAELDTALRVLGDLLDAQTRFGESLGREADPARDADPA